ncbi:MAG: hypothetical protein ACR2NX_09425 [Chthoniobacterales bacterium]
MRILILGGTGFTGPFRVKYARARGQQVTVFNRGKTHPGELPEGVEQLLGDRNGNLNALKDRQWDVAIDNPTSVPVWVRDVAQVLKGNAERYVFISTISVYADNSKPNEETSPLSKYEGADAMKESRFDHCLEVSTLRPAEGALGSGGGEVGPRKDARASAGIDRGTRRRDGSIYLLAGAHRSRWRSAGAGRTD